MLDTDALQKLVSEAEDLRNYRTSGIIYSEKCAQVVERINCFFDTLDVENLTEQQESSLNSIKQILYKEEQFAISSLKIRSPKQWKDFLNDG